MKPFVADDFQIDLQLFGGGSGKKITKAVLTVGAFFFGAGGAGMAFFGTTSSIAGGMMGMSLFSAVWALGSSRNQNNGSGNGLPSIVRFDREQESMSLGGVIPVVYGRRMIAGNQTYHQSDADANNLHKHVVLCEGGIEGLETVTACGYNIPQGDDKSLGVFTIQNRKYPDAKATITNKTLSLYANGKSKKLALKNTDDLQSGETFFAWQLESGALISYINRLGDGWEAFPTATTSKYAGDYVIHGNGACYKIPVPVISSGCVGVTSMKFYDGETPSNYEEVGGYPNMAWLDLKFTVSNNLNGNPNIEALVKGRKVYDTRTEKWAYSTNPAMCLRDLLLNKTYGAGQWLTAADLDEDSFKEAANYCDVKVNYQMADGTVVESKRFELNLVMDNKQSVWDWAQAILASFQGYLVFSKNKLHLRIEKATETSYSFDESSINELSLSQSSLDDCPNQYRCKFIDPLNNWKTATVIVDDASDQKERQKVVSKDVELEGVTSQAQALRLARFYRDYNKVCSLQVEFKTGYEAVHLEPGDVISLTYKKVFYQALFRITEIQETQDGEFTIKGRQYNATIYNDSLGANITAYNYATIKPSFGTPLPPTNVKVKVLEDIAEYPITRLKARISWNESVTNFNTSYNVYRKYSTSDKWEFVGNTTSNSYVVDEKQDANVSYSVVTVSGSGIASKRVSTYQYTLHLEDKPPATPTGVILTPKGATFTAVWDNNTEEDFDHYEITYNGRTYTAKSPVFSTTGKDGYNTISIVAVDKGNNKSPAVSKTIAMLIRPADISFVSISKYNGYVLLKWPASVGATYYTITGNTNIVTFSTQATIHIDSAGTFTYYVTACNDYDTSKKYEVKVKCTKEDFSDGANVYSANLFDGINLSFDTEFVVDDGVNVIIKKEK